MHLSHLHWHVVLVILEGYAKSFWWVLGENAASLAVTKRTNAFGLSTTVLMMQICLLANNHLSSIVGGKTIKSQTSLSEDALCLKKRKLYSIYKKIGTLFHEKMWSWYVAVKWGICLQKMFTIWDENKTLSLLLNPFQPDSVLPAPICRVATPGMVWFFSSFPYTEYNPWSSNFSCERCSNFLNSYCSKDVFYPSDISVIAHPVYRHAKHSSEAESEEVFSCHRS